MFTLLPLACLWKPLSEMILSAWRCAVLKGSGDRGHGTLIPCSFEPQPNRLQLHGWSTFNNDFIWEFVWFYLHGWLLLDLMFCWLLTANIWAFIDVFHCSFSPAEHWFLSYFPWPGWCVDLALHRMLETMCSLQSDGLPSTLLHQLGLRVSHGARRWPLLNGQLKRPLPNQGPSRKENPRPKQPRKPELSGAGETI